ncbi:hypothetical protein PEPS_45030 (plasmid) [Persicobacter psychrovividus]|uniref:DUF1819 family protein n=2 Tax=Persicobacter psychrovividus TaxID=387638 RepID=A0ABM7VMH5_9BACT|nr:hypothetical protein PEPS_45030 [Persicobacter psychrovividus]
MPNKKYSFTFTLSLLRLSEFSMVMNALLRGQGTKDELILNFGNGKIKTGSLLYSELSKRAKALTPEQQEFYLDADLPTQKLLALLAVCKVYPFIRDFILEVLRNKVLLFDDQLSRLDYDRFFENKKELHDEVLALSENTERKVRRAIFGILLEAGLIEGEDGQYQIQRPWVSGRLEQVIRQDKEEWLMVLLHH